MEKKVRFSALDAIIITGVIALAALAYWYFGIRSGDAEPVTVYFTFEAVRQQESFAELPKPGDRIYDSVRGYYLGEVVHVRYEKAYLVGFEQGVFMDSDSESIVFNPGEPGFNEGVIDGEINIFITVRCDGTESPDVITLADGNYEIRVGKHMYIKGRGNAAYAAEGYGVGLSLNECHICPELDEYCER
jgi:hypothetical protein